MRENDRLYFRRRADIELERAQQATSVEVVRAHYQMAEAYLNRLASAEPIKGRAS